MLLVQIKAKRWAKIQKLSNIFYWGSRHFPNTAGGSADGISPVSEFGSKITYVLALWAVLLLETFLPNMLGSM